MKWLVIIGAALLVIVLVMTDTRKPKKENHSPEWMARCRKAKKMKALKKESAPAEMKIAV